MSYTVGSYRKAIRRACLKANVPIWHPHQLRHTAATNIRCQFGLEVAQAVLGHSEIGDDPDLRGEESRCCPPANARNRVTLEIASGPIERAPLSFRQVSNCILMTTGRRELLPAYGRRG